MLRAMAHRLETESLNPWGSDASRFRTDFQRFMGGLGQNCATNCAMETQNGREIAHPIRFLSMFNQAWLCS